MDTMGERIRNRLRELGKSQHWLAEQVGIRQPSIHAILKGGSGHGSKHIVKIAEVLGVYPKWLTEGEAPKLVARSREAPIVGYVGAGAEVIRFDEGVVLEGVVAPHGVEGSNAARVRGESMPPFRDGWLIFYGPEHQGVPETCMGKLSVVGLKDGTTLIKILHRGSRRGLFDLESWNAPLRRDAPVEWAALVYDIRPV